MDILKLVEEVYEKKIQKGTTQDEPEIKSNELTQGQENSTENKLNSSETPNLETKLIVKAIVDRLNNGETFSQVEKKFKMNKTAIRVLLRNNGYNYNHLFNVWTNLSELTLLKVLKKNLKDSEISLYEYARKHRINYETLQKKLNLSEDESNDYQVSSSRENNSPSEELPLQQEKVNPSSMSKQIESYFSVDELLIIKSLILERKADSNSKVEVPIFLDKDTFRNLIKFSTDENQTISDIIKSWIEEKTKEPK
ncbi:hypothetical protein ACOJQI_11855 [Bacillus salacetis]|uniref:hypothetical protein n=1 Tax=Bacillus salacetis TaxID=2315464 RepID=UPI003BA3D57A